MYGGKRCTGVKKHPTEITATIIFHFFFFLYPAENFFILTGEKSKIILLLYMESSGR